MNRAVNRGGCIEIDEEGEMMYYFKSGEIAEVESLTEKQDMARTKQTTQAAFETVAKFVRSLGWSLTVTEKQMQAAKVKIHIDVQTSHLAIACKSG